MLITFNFNYYSGENMDDMKREEALKGLVSHYIEVIEDRNYDVVGRNIYYPGIGEDSRVPIVLVDVDRKEITVEDILESSDEMPDNDRIDNLEYFCYQVERESTGYGLGYKCRKRILIDPDVEPRAELSGDIFVSDQSILNYQSLREMFKRVFKADLEDYSAINDTLY